MRPRTPLYLLASLLIAAVLAGCSGDDDTGTNPTPRELDSGVIGPAQSYQHRFLAPGTFDYRCLIHSSMTGSVLVSDAAPPGDTAIGVAISADDFPDLVTVRTGGKVTWTNNDPHDHTVTSR